MDKQITGIKREKQKQFFSKASLLIDKARFKIIEHINSIESLEDIKLNMLKRIKDDSIKINAMNSLDIDEFEIVDIIAGLKSDDKKIEALKIIDDEWMKVEIAKTIKDDNKKLVVIDSLKEEYIGELAKSIKGLEKLDNARGLSELIKTTKLKDNGQDLIKNIDEQIKQFEEIRKLKNDDQKIEAINNVESEYLKAEIAKTIKDDDKKIKILESFNNEWSKVIVAEEIQDDNKKIELINILKDNHSILKVTCSIKDEENKIKVLDSFKKEHLKCMVAVTIRDDEKKLELIASFKSEILKEELAKTIRDDDKKIESLRFLNDDGKFRIALRLKEDKKINYIVENLGYEHIKSFYEMYEEDQIKENNEFKEIGIMLNKTEKIMQNSSDQKKIEFIDSINNEKLKMEVIARVKDDNKKITLLEKLGSEKFKEYRNTSEDIDFIKNNIDKFIEEEGFEGDIPEGIIDELYKKNNSVVTNIDFRLLNKRYIELLGKDKINLISCYPKIQEQVLSLQENECYIFSKCIDNYMKTMETDEWTVLAQDLLENFSKGEYSELLENISNIEELTPEDFKSLTQVLQNNNWCNITQMSQVSNFKEIRRQKLDEIMDDKNATIEQKKEAVLQKIFGHDIKYAEEIVEKFGEDISNINDGDSKDYVRSLKLIQDIEDIDILEEIYNNCEFVQTDKVIIERTLKNEYGKLFNKGLYSPRQEDLVDEKFNIYEASTDFKIIMTSVGAYVDKENKNYKDDWNRPSIATQHFCASYIRNDMIGTAPINNICYGFSEMKEDSLMLSGNVDIYSSANTFNSTGNSREKYYTPDEQINNTKDYNEMDFRRIQGGVKKQPDYILVFRKNGLILNKGKAIKASKQWGGIPIVIVDKDKCLKSEREKVDQMIKEYKKNPDPKLGKQIKQKIRNNRVTSKYFCNDIDIKLRKIQEIDYEKESDKNIKIDEFNVTEEDLQENYGQVSAIERKKGISMFKMVYNKIKEVTRGDEHEK